MRHAVAAVVLGALAAAANAAPRYVAVSLGTLGGDSIIAAAINERGEVTGWAQDANGEWRAFVHSGGVLKPLDVPLATWALGNAINASGDVAGCASIEGQDRGFVYRGGTVSLLPPVNGVYYVGSAVGINDGGHVVGHQYLGVGYPAPSYRYFAGGFEDIQAIVAGISNGGAYVGTSYPRNGPPQAFATNTALRTVLTFGRESYATAINERGQVTGSYYPYATNEGPMHAYLYSDGMLLDLGSLDGIVVSDRRIVGGLSSGHGINGRGEVVGTSDGRAFVFTGGEMQDLNMLVDDGLAETRLTSASDINNSAMVIANSCNSSPPYPCKAFLLTPVADAASPANVPVLSQAALALLALMVLACGTRSLRR